MPSSVPLRLFVGRGELNNDVNQAGRLSQPVAWFHLAVRSESRARRVFPLSPGQLQVTMSPSFGVMDGVPCGGHRSVRGVIGREENS